MKADDILLIGLKSHVAAISRSDGRIIWDTEVRGGGWTTSSGFITLASDGEHDFAYSNGHLYCLELLSGRLLWKNELPGYGYGLAGLCVPGYRSAPDVAAVEQLLEQHRAAAAHQPGAGSH